MSESRVGRGGARAGSGAAWRAACLSLGLGVFASLVPAPALPQAGPHDSGGPMLPEQAAYDVTFYDLSLGVNPADSTIEGRVTTVARVVAPMEWLVLDLDPVLTVRGAATVGRSAATLTFERRGGKLWIRLPEPKRAGDEIAVEVAYGGRPRIAPHPPWDGGFTWARTPDGRPWVGTSNQTNGSDLWWPSKDHVSDKPDSMAIRVTVPGDLVVATNGRLDREQANADGTRTFHWRVSTPISAYNVSLSIAPYRILHRMYTSVTGEPFPTYFFVLPQDEARGEALYPEILAHLRWHEELLGPYPFRADKYGVVQTPYLGMEHQTIIAYGANFNNAAMTGRDFGFDALHHHELSHEWWGNMVTNADWADMWLHEGFGSYMQALYMEHLQGEAGYQAYMRWLRSQVTDRMPVAPRGSLTTNQIYQAPIYDKGAWALHTLRWLIGDEPMRRALRRMAYPDPAMERVTDGGQVRFATTEDFRRLVEEIAGRPLDWFFEVYVRTAALPRLVVERNAERMSLRWEAPGGVAFPMPVELRIGDELRRVELPGGRATIAIPAGREVVIDPNGWLLRAEPRRE